MFTEADLAGWDPEPLRQALAAAGYTGAAFRTADADDRMRVARSGSPTLATAHALFGAGRPVAESEARAMLGAACDPLIRLGLLVPDGERLRSVARLEPDGDSWFASDHPSRIAGEPEHVMGVGHSTRILGALAPGREGRRALDLCTGAGWVALDLARSGCEVTAADVSARALGFARFNAGLRGVAAIEWLEGDRFAPVEGRRFDLITANPPFVISPETTYTFRDSGRPGTAFCEDLARAIPGFLAPGGVAIMLLSWFDDGDDGTSHGPLEWAEDSDCSAWLFRTLTQDPAEYARQWLGDIAAGGPVEAPDLKRWMEHFAGLGAQRLHTGFLILHRGGPDRWRRSDARRMEQLRVDADRDILAVIRGESWLAREQPDADRLVAHRYEVPDGLRLESVAELRNDWTNLAQRLLSPARLAYDGPVDAALPRLLSGCRSGLTPTEALADFGAPTERLAPVVRELVRHGLLLPSDRV